MQIEPDSTTHWDLAAQPAPKYEVERCLNWRLSEAEILTHCGLNLRPKNPTHTANHVSEHQTLVMNMAGGAALSYYSVFSMAPLLLVVISIAGLVFG